mmetsp:Transcript_35222/g.109184  ORF Transcript_35222/g.109184 Transcript_35222/m.109184 type:complete len:608 (-) Transcript_35222:18-1841(-)
MMRCRAINAIVLTILAATNALHPAVVAYPRATAGAATRVLSDRRPTASPTCVGVDRRLAIRDAAVAEAPAEEVDALPLPTEERAALSVTERLSRSLTFYSRVLPILARYKLAELDLEQRCASEEECSLEYAELDDWGSDRLRDAILELQGFYVKSGQVLSTRVDLFAQPYTDKLQVLQEGLAPIPAEVVREVVRRELCGEGGDLGELFASFDDEPLGCASIAQVHAATLLDGRKVAVKVQRPGAKPLLKADVANLKRFSKLLADALPVDYYTVFSELGDVLEGELDFLQEAQAMEKLHAAVRFRPDGAPADPPLKVPRAVPGLATTRVLVMEFLEGVSLNNLADEAKKRGIEPGSPEAKILGASIVEALGEAYARMIFGAGFVHGDPHPGNVFIQPGGRVALLDCGQTKQLSSSDVDKLERVISTLQAYRRAPDDRAALAGLGDAVRAYGVDLRPREIDDLYAPTAEAAALDDDACLAAIAVTLFGDKSVDAIPGGYSADELSADSPLKRLKSFPQALVLMGRAAVIIRGIASKLEVNYSLADAWEQAAAERITNLPPPWARAENSAEAAAEPRLRDVLKARARRVAERVLPSRAKRWLARRIASRL